MDHIPKPHELLAARDLPRTSSLSCAPGSGCGTRVTLDLEAIDSAVAELGDPQLVMAMAMRKLQAFHLLTTPGVGTTTDVVLTVVQDLERALVQAPRAYLRNAAAAADWDAALAAIEEPGGEAALHVARSGLVDEAMAAFARNHQALRAAARAVLQVSEGQIRTLI